MGHVFRAGAAYVLLALTSGAGPALAQSATGATGAGPGQAAAQGSTPGAAANADPQENLTVLGHRKKFETAPMPGPELRPPPDTPDTHLGRYKISGDQNTPDGHDAQTGAFIAPFGTAYTGAGPVAGGLASHFQH